MAAVAPTLAEDIFTFVDHLPLHVTTG
jgi:hypothetical protein